MAGWVDRAPGSPNKYCLQAATITSAVHEQSAARKLPAEHDPAGATLVSASGPQTSGVESSSVALKRAFSK
jgi:hypothetical protein|tara:strand:- start:514 stop:726 length:213 start_codon:yes stop_codon:yes gene_type:complete